MFVPMILPYLSELNSKYLSDLELNTKTDCSGFAVSAPFADPEPNRSEVHSERVAFRRKSGQVVDDSRIPARCG